jgi:hypothetical protein
LFLSIFSTIGQAGGDNIAKCENDIKCQNDILEPVTPKVADFEDFFENDIIFFVEYLKPVTPKVADFNDSIQNNNLKNEKN